MKEKINNKEREDYIENFPHKYFPLVTASITAISLYLGFSIAGMLSGGVYVFNRGDLAESHVAYILDMCRSIINGESIWYSYTISMGMNTALVLAYYTLSPFNILFLLFNKFDPNAICCLIVILKLSLSAAFFQIFSNKVLKRDNLWSIIISICYALCGFSAVYGTYHIMWLDGFMMLPLLCFLIIRSFEKNKYVAVSLCYAYIFICQFYIGFMIGVFSLLFVILYLIYTYNQDFKTGILYFLKWILSVFVGILISSFVWMPALMFLIANNPPDATQFPDLEASIMEILNSLFWGQYSDNIGRKSYSYSGLLAVLAVPFYFFNKKIKLKERILSGTILVFFLLCYVVPPLYAFMHANDAPDYFWYRFSFLFSFILCCITVRQSEFFHKIHIKKYILYILVLLMFYVIEQRLSFLENENYVTNNIYNMLINCAFIIFWLAIIFGYKYAKPNRAALYLISFILVGLETSSNMVISLDNKTLENEYDNFVVIDETAVNHLNSIDSDFYRVIIRNDLTHNSDSQFGYKGIIDFGSGENYLVRNTLSNMGFASTPRMTMGTGYNPVNEMLLGVRYKVYGAYYHDYGIREYDLNDLVGIEKNDMSLNVGYMVDDDILSYSFPSRNVFNNLNTLMKTLSQVDEDCFLEIPKDNIHYFYKNSLVYFNEDTGKYYFEKKADEALVTVNIDSMNDWIPYVQFEIPEASVLQNSPSVENGCLNIANPLDPALLSSASFEIAPVNDGFRYTFGANEKSDEAYEFDGINYYYYVKESAEKHFKELSKEQFFVTDYSNGHIKGTLSSSEPGKVLFLTIPYDKGWSAIVNGRPSEIVPVLGNSFMAIPLQGEGSFEISLDYTTPGLRTGIILMSVGVILTVLWAFMEKDFSYLKTFRKKDEHDEHVENT